MFIEFVHEHKTKCEHHCQHLYNSFLFPSIYEYNNYDVMWYVMNEWKNEWHLVCTSNNSFCLLFMYSLSWQPSYGFRFQFNFFLIILCSFLEVIFCYEKTIFIILKTFIINITFDNSWFHLLRVYAFICKYVFISFKILCYAFCIYSYKIPFICVFFYLKRKYISLETMPLN